ncbi:MAG TPA: efflux RND transporter periplasmic adaptor subunit [Chitinophaga sp.]|nr:efflux RND transporter periplasmic adaptor subunit [Chitinophaga sp.]
MKKIRYSIVLLILVILIGAVVIKLNANKEEVEAKVYRKDPNLRATVQVDTVSYRPFGETTSFLGAFAPGREVTISSETTGKVVTVGVEEGSAVNTGHLIAQLDTELLRAQLASAQASYDNAVSTLKRYEQAASGVTQLQIDNARTQLLTTKAQIDQLKKQIRTCTISAPFSGVITNRNFDLGAVVNAGAQIAELTDVSRLKLEINVPEKNIAQFRQNQRLNVVTDVYPDKIFEGIVDMVAIKTDASHNYTVKIVVANSRENALKAGMYGRILLKDVTSPEAISIPRSAIVGSSKEPQVFVIRDSVAALKNIEVGAGNETRVQVTKGLEPGELVVIGGLVNLVEGSKVTIANK